MYSFNKLISLFPIAGYGKKADHPAGSPSYVISSNSFYRSVAFSPIIAKIVSR